MGLKDGLISAGVRRKRMRKARLKPRGTERNKCFLGAIERLEDRCLLAPVMVTGTSYQSALGGGGAAAGFADDGFISFRLISTQAGRIEADPTGAFGNDLFVVSRGTAVGTGGLVPSGANPGDLAGNIYRIDPYGANAFGASPADNRRLFATIPGGGSSFGGYEDWFDIAFDSTGNFTGSPLLNGAGPTMFVSSLDSTTTPGINPRNAIYAFLTNGDLAAPAGVPLNPGRVTAFSTLDVVQPGILDSQIGAIAVAPGDTFGRDLYVLDVACDNAVGVTCAAGDGNSMFRVRPVQADPVDLDASALFNDHVEGVLPILTPAPANNDIDVRAMVFDPNRGITLQGQFGGLAFQLYGGLFVASSDLEANDTALTRVLHFPSPGSPPLDIVAPAAIATRLIGDMTFDPVGYFGGGIFITDYISRSVQQITQDPATGLATITTIANNFNVLTPTDFTGVTPPGDDPADAYRDAFSISFSADGEILFVSDRDGVWAFYANTLAHSSSGAAIGLTDVRELRAPYSGKGLATAVIDSGVDGSHLGFRGTVTAGFNPAFPGPGNFDLTGHGTAVAGIIHQLAPDALIVPINTAPVVGIPPDTTGTAGTTPFFTAQDLYNSVRFVRDHPIADDPRTAAVEAFPIVGVNMSVGVRLPDDPDGTLDTDAEAVATDQSVAIPLKALFQDYLEMGIVPVAAAGNSGAGFNGISGARVPAVLNEVIEVAGAYPFGPVTTGGGGGGGGGVGGTASGFGPPLNLTQSLRCQVLSTGGGGGGAGTAQDFVAFPGKIPAFSNRNVTTDYVAPGTCVSTYAVSLFVNSLVPSLQAVRTAPILPNFDGTSASAPIVTGNFIYGFDVVSTWAEVLAAGGTISAVSPDETIRRLNQYLTRELTLPGVTAPTITLGGAVPANIAAYLNPDGVNSILQWTAIPREDVNIGESFGTPNGVDDSVAQERAFNSHRYRVYSHLHMGNALAAVEGTIALNFFIANPAALAALDAAAGTPGLITAVDIDTFVDDPLASASARAMARLLGGASRIARLNRLAYLDLVQDAVQNGGIFTAEIVDLAGRLLPEPTDFRITGRAASADRPYALDPTAIRNYQALKFRPDDVFRGITKKLRRMSPDEFTFGSRGAAGLSFLPATGTISLMEPRLRVVGRSSPVESCGDGFDDNDNGRIDEGCEPRPLVEICGDGIDNDANGQIDEGCPPPPPGTEVCGDGIDNDSDGLIDDGCPTGPGGSGPDVEDIRQNFVAIDESGGAYLYSTSEGDLLEYARGADSTWSVTNVSDATAAAPICCDLLALDRPGGSTRTVFALDANGHVVRFDRDGESWSTSDMTGQNLPALANSLTGLVMQVRGVESVRLYGLNSIGHLIEYRPARVGYIARDVTAETRGPILQPGLASWGETVRNKDRIYVYGVSAAGTVEQYTWTGRRWVRLNLTALASGPVVVPGSLAVPPRPPTGRGAAPGVFALDNQGSLWHFFGRWESVTAMAGSDAIVGELAVQYDATDAVSHVYGRNAQGGLVRHSGRLGSWTSDVLVDSGVAAGADLAVSTGNQATYAELVDGALAEFWFDDGWKSRLL
jgi:hypothetical protein